MQELRVVDALLTTARAPHAGDITPAVVSVTQATQPHAPRRVPFGLALLLYLFVAWALGVVAILRRHDLGRFASAALAHVQRDVAALGAAIHALAPATPMAAAAVTAVLLVDLVLLGAVLYGYRRLRPMLAGYLNRGPRP